MIRRPRRPTLFPYPTLCRSRPSQIITQRSVENALRVLLAIGGSTNALIHLTAVAGRVGVEVSLRRLNTLSRSEEHTSELQSQSNLVCRLLLEQKTADVDSRH